jgi:hypothetical protein
VSAWTRARAVALLCGLAAGGCNAASDLGSPCLLLRSNPDGGAPLVVLEGDLPVAPSDYLSLGSPQCVDQVCVRDAQVPRSGDTQAPATGYCSRPCAATGAGGCGGGAGGGFACRALLLDPSGMAGFCAANSPTCKGLGADPGALFCARGAAP